MILKTLIACYSYSGNTYKVASDLKKKLHADFTRIETQSDTNYLFKSINALLKKKTPIKPCSVDMKNYDTIVICSPVWAGRAPPAINEYISKLKNTGGKKFGVLVTYGSSGNRKTVGQIRSALEKEQMYFIDSMSVRQKEIGRGDYATRIDEYALSIARG